jgi:PKD repeat protein
VVQAQGLVLAALALALGSAAPVHAAVPGLVELVADRSPAIVPPSAVAPAAPPSPPAGFVALRGAAVPTMAPEEVDVRMAVPIAAAFVCRTPDRVRVAATVDWGDGTRGPATVRASAMPPTWLTPPPALAALMTASPNQGTIVASHAYSAADLYTIRVTLDVTRESDGATSSFVRTHRLRVRDPALATQPWMFELDSISFTCNGGQACSFPFTLDARVETHARFKFGASWLAGHTAAWEWGDGATSVGTISGTGGQRRAVGTHVYAKGGKLRVKLTLTGRYKDGTSEVRTQNVDVLVADVALDPILGPVDSAPTGIPATFQGVYRYGDGKRTRRATWTWGDGKTTPGEISERSGLGSVFGQHVYAKAGRYKVVLAVGDPEAEVTTSLEITVSSPGTVTASGHIACPAGVFVSDRTVSGIARFDLNARHDGATPSGTFRLSGPSFEFVAERFDSLAISATEANATGTGTLNGQRPYTFTIDVWKTPAADGGPRSHWARVRITDQAKQANVFDNDVFDGALQPFSGGRVRLVTE